MRIISCVRAVTMQRLCDANETNHILSSCNGLTIYDTISVKIYADIDTIILSRIVGDNDITNIR